MPSFALAVDQGCAIIECDVHVARDGHLVVIHDATVDRTTDGSGPVRSHTVAELQSLDAGSWFGSAFVGARIPTLDELLVWAKPRALVAIELKQPATPYPDYEAKAIAAIQRHNMRDRVIFISFDHDLLRRVRGLDPAVATGAVYGATLPGDPIALARAIGATALHPRADLVTPALARAARAANIVVSAWTVDPEPLTGEAAEPAADHSRVARPRPWRHDAARALAATGLDSIASNFPDRLRRLI